jgi:hypothetical protein
MVFTASSAKRTAIAPTSADSFAFGKSQPMTLEGHLEQECRIAHWWCRPQTLCDGCVCLRQFQRSYGMTHAVANDNGDEISHHRVRGNPTVRLARWHHQRYQTGGGVFTAFWLLNTLLTLRTAGLASGWRTTPRLSFELPGGGGSWLRLRRGSSIRWVTIAAAASWLCAGALRQRQLRCRSCWAVLSMCTG